MTYKDYYIKDSGIHSRALGLTNEAHQDVKHLFSEIDDRAQYHQSRILDIFDEHRVSQMHFVGTTGYGYGDNGRDVLDLVFKDLFECEDDWCALNGFRELM